LGQLWKLAITNTDLVRNFHVIFNGAASFIVPEDYDLNESLPPDPSDFYAEIRIISLLKHLDPAGGQV